MAVMTPGAVIGTLVYNCAVIATLVMTLVFRYERWWIGLVVMAGAVLFAVLESFCWAVSWSVDDIKNIWQARKLHDGEERNREMERCKKAISAIPFEISLIMGLLVAIFGLFAIPVLVFWGISDLFSEIRENILDRRKNLA